MIPNIEDEKIRNDLSEINESVTKIISTIEKSPKKVEKIGNFFDYYLPITVKIVDRYDDIENQKLSSSDSKKFLKSTNKMVGEANKAFKKILDDLYEKEIVDIDAEIKVFDSLLKADGFNENELSVKEGDTDE
jgi:5-bromo-4-chloroindolyl phosphate hydrolysis protein